ncbi:MAG: alanine racemase [Rhodospirillales bacterium]|nr:alanine racemase [Rhodospirillales bacterium]
MRLADLPTPSLVLDRSRLMRNVARMRARAKELGVTLRPHMKTAKSVDVAKAVHGGATGPITVSTLAEAEHFAKAGFSDMLYAVAIAPAKLDRAAALMRAAPALKILTDDVEAAKAIAERGKTLGVRFNAVVEIETGGARAGVDPTSPELAAIAATLGRAGMLAGVMAHAGHSYGCDGIAEIEEVAEAERAGVVAAAGFLRTKGHAFDLVSVGSTPTALHARHLQGVTEMRPGNFVFFDLFQHGLGMCGAEDIAVGVLASVIGHHRARNHLLLDAGALALSKDTGANRRIESVGYGLIRDPGAASPREDLAVLDVHQEHGILSARRGLDAIDPLPFADWPIGRRVLVMPNHVCMTSAMYTQYHVVDGGDEVVAVWDRVNGW